jgi:hypothetical protein
MNPPALVRQASVNALRDRIGSEQYSRVLSESGDILLIDYTRECRTILVLKQGTLYPHAFFEQVYCNGETVLKLQVVDLATGCVLPDWKCDSSDTASLTWFKQTMFHFLGIQHDYVDTVESRISLKLGCVYEGPVHIISPIEGDIGVYVGSLMP